MFDEARTEAQTKLSVLVTGANGFVGSAIALLCQQQSMRVSATGRTSVNAENLPNYFTADVTAPDSLAGAMKGVDAVVHAAGLAHQFDKGRDDASRFMSINASGAEHVARTAREAGVRHFILISSVSVYGAHEESACDEETPCRPQDAYAQSKHEAERRAIEIFKETNTCLTILRLATVYGEGDRGNILRLIRTIDRGRFIWIGRGENRKSLIHVEDAARACTAVLLSPCEGIHVYNVSAPAQKMHEIVGGIAAALGRKAHGLHIPPRAALAAASFLKSVSLSHAKFSGVKATIEKWLADDVYDARKFEERFDFKSQVNFKEGIEREVAWYLKSQNRLR
jgi:nucleoside-diphosphate-sugar epimerase